MFERAREELEKLGAARGSWTVPQTRSGRRSMRVETLLKKEKAGTLRKKTEHLEQGKLAAAMHSYRTIESSEDMAPTGSPARPPKKKGEAPSVEDQDSDAAAREDRRGFTATLPSPGVSIDVKVASGARTMNPNDYSREAIEEQFARIHITRGKYASAPPEEKKAPAEDVSSIIQKKYPHLMPQDHKEQPKTAAALASRVTALLKSRSDG